MARGKGRQSFHLLLFAGLTGLALGTSIRAGAEERLRCTCSNGRSIEPGAVYYSGNSDRETITKVEVDENSPEHPCVAVWIEATEVHPEGTPYSFYLKRITLGEQREEACGGSAEHFTKRTKTYQFAFHSKSQSIREVQPLDPQPDGQSVEPDASSKSNVNLWSSISANAQTDSRNAPRRASQILFYPEFCRTAWVVARKDITGHYVGLVSTIDQGETLVPLKKTYKIRAGQLGQIEASKVGSAIVRFYEGSGIEKLGNSRNRLRRWYHRVGGPYAEVKDDLYTPLRAHIVEVLLDEIVEINDYLDQQRTDQTGPLSFRDTPGESPD